jgi:hypothetical protein
MVGILCIFLWLNYFIHSTKLLVEINKNIYTKIITKNDDNEYLIKDYNFMKERKIISVSPGGYKGFYMMGIVSYIKKNYNLDDYIFSGVSTGSWCSLFLCYNKNPNIFIHELMNIDYQNSNCLNDINFLLKYKILDHFSEEDFHLNKLFIGVTLLEHMELQTNIYNDFDTLEDALDCCVASSNLPFDGRFCKYPNINSDEPVLHISADMWSNYLEDDHLILDFRDLYMSTNILKLFEDGYNDAKKNKYFLDNKII